MFTTAIDKYLYRSSEIELDYMKSNYGQDYINANYDMIVFPTANIFGTHYIQGLERYTDFFRKIKIPVYVIGAGIQCNSYDDISDLAAKLKETVGEFISAVYQTGGEFALRGYATKEFLDLIIKNTAVVTGCPSLYQNGRELKVNTEKVEKEKFRVALNGSVKSINATNLKKIIDYVTYMDQDEFAELLYANNYTYKISEAKALWRYSYSGLRMVSEKRVNLIYDIPVWLKYMERNFDFSLGTRIHGNIAATLSGIPSLVIPIDARTRELAEFFEIPFQSSFKIRNIEELYELYCSLDYEKFNRNFKNKFDDFEKFMRNHNIVDKIGPFDEYNEMIKQNEWNEPLISDESSAYAKSILDKYPRILLKLFSGSLYSKAKELRTYKIKFTVLGDK